MGANEAVLLTWPLASRSTALRLTDLCEAGLFRQTLFTQREIPKFLATCSLNAINMPLYTTRRPSFKVVSDRA